MAARIDIDASATAVESVTKQLERQDAVLASIKTRWAGNVNLCKVAVEVAKDEVKLTEKLSNIQNSIESKTKEIAFWENQRLHHAAAVAGMGGMIRAEQNRLLRLLEKEYDERNRINAILEKEAANLLIMQKSGLQGLTEKTKEWGNMLSKADKMIIAESAAFIIMKNTLGQIWKIFDRLDTAAADFRRSMGIVRSQSSDIETVARGIAVQYMGIGVSAKDVYESLKAIAETAGSTRSYTREMVSDMSLFSAQFGITAQTSAKFLKTMASVSKSTMSTQKDMLMIAQRMAAAAGVPLDAVMQDVASASEKGYQFLSRDPLILLKSAVQAKLLGTTLQSSTDSAKSLLDFTNSVKSEMEASVLLGKSMNLQKARELAYHRDIEGLNREIVKLAKEADFEQLDPFQQESVAKALGKSAGEVANMLESDREHSKVLQAMSSEDRKRYDSLMNMNKSQVKNYAEMARDEVQKMSNQKATLAISQAWSAIFASIGEVFLPLIAGLLTVIAKMLNSTTVKWIAGLGMAAISVWSIYKVFKLISVTLSGIKVLTGAIAKSVSPTTGGGLGGMITSLGKAIGRFPWAAIGKLAVGIVLIAGLGLAVMVLSKGFASFAGIDWGAVMKGLGVLTLFGIVAGVMGMGPVAAAIGIGELLIAGMGIALAVFSVGAMLGAKAMTMVGEALPVMVDGLKSLNKIGMIEMVKIAAKLYALTAAMAGLSLLAVPMMLFGTAIGIVAMGMSPFLTNLKNLESINFDKTITQISNLATAIMGLGVAMKSIPDIKLDKLSTPSFGGGGGGIEGQKKDTTSDTLQAIKDAIDGLRTDFKSGAVTATVFIDSQKLDSIMGRRLAYTGALV